ncbi:MAG: transketolase [Spirochaetales bacterium]|nr:transketolase [Candidatus Physcosoma equi]
MDKKKLEELKEKAFEIRCLTINEISAFGSGHIGGAMSITDVLTYLYYKEMNIDPKDPKKDDRDRIVISKGHAGPAVYATLASKGFFPEEMLSTLNQGGTNLPSHCDMLKTPGIDFTAGSLGQGISAAVGIALGNRVKKCDAWTYTIIGDGESQEGQVWEAAEFAGAQKLDNLIAFEDVNGQQLDSYTADIIPEEVEPVAKRWESFGWDVQIVDGHDFEALDAAIQKAKKTAGKPHMLVMKTTKSYGYIPGEGIKANHSMAIKPEDATAAIQALKEREGR